MSDSINVEDFVAGLKVAELKEELKKRGQNVYGVKAVLAQRLLSVMKGQEDDTAENQDYQVEGTQENEEEVEGDKLCDSSVLLLRDVLYHVTVRWPAVSCEGWAN